MWTVFPRMSAHIKDTVSASGRKFHRDEAGSLVIFTLFLFVMILLIAGTAIDAMRHETRRVALQNTLDSAILAAASLNQSINAETLIKDHVAKAGMNPDKITVGGTDTLSANGSGDLIARNVTVTADVDTPTMFMSMMGINDLTSAMGSGAEEAIMNIEISVVVDISGSMGNNSKLANLKVAAKDFVTHVLTVGPNADRTTVSIIPYNATVVVGDDLLSELNALGTVETVLNPPAYPGAMATYNTEHNDSTCVRFSDTDFDDRAIAPTTPLTRLAHFRDNGTNYGEPSMNQRWCNENRSEILVHSRSESDLHTHIDAMSSGGWTGIDNGMKWGVALLDPALAPAISNMVTANILDSEVEGRPGIYDANLTKKIVVLMTDGANTIQNDLKQEFKNGPTRVWHAASRTVGFDSALGRNLTVYDGYFVEMPNNASSQRWYVPGSPWTTADDLYLDESLIPADAVQFDHLELNRRFARKDLRKFLFEHSDATAYAAYNNSVETFENAGSADTRLEDICDKANENALIEVYAIGFEAPQAGLDVMQYCASAPGNFFDVQGTNISAAFDAIAGQITLLRLTN